MKSKTNIFKDVQTLSSSPSYLLFPENCSAEYLERCVDEIWEPVHTDRSFVPWFHDQAKEYLEYAIKRRIEDIYKKHCE